MDSGEVMNLVGHLLLGKVLETENLQFWPARLSLLRNPRAIYKAWWADQAGNFVPESIVPNIVECFLDI